jgi:hypothetical protein
MPSARTVGKSDPVELWEILVTAAAGLSAGQIGAWLQARRDHRVELQRQAAETERLRLQLTEAGEQHERDRRQTDTHEWRERRLAAYQAASSASKSLLHSAREVILSDAEPSLSAAVDRCQTACRELEPALDLCAIIGTKQTLSAAESFAGGATGLAVAVLRFAAQISRISAAGRRIDQPAKATRSLKAVQALRLGQTAEHVNEDIERILTLNRAVEVAWDEAFDHSEAWHKAARAELGVPD